MSHSASPPLSALVGAGIKVAFLVASKSPSIPGSSAPSTTHMRYIEPSKTSFVPENASPSPPFIATGAIAPEVPILVLRCMQYPAGLTRSLLVFILLAADLIAAEHFCSGDPRNHQLNSTMGHILAKYERLASNWRQKHFWRRVRNYARVGASSHSGTLAALGFSNEKGGRQTPVRGHATLFTWIQSCRNAPSASSPVDAEHKGESERQSRRELLTGVICPCERVSTSGHQMIFALTMPSSAVFEFNPIERYSEANGLSFMTIHSLKVRFCVYAGRGREAGSGEHGVETGGDGGRESWDGAYQGGRSGLRTTYDAHAARARGEFGFGFGRFGSIRFVLANAHPGNQQPRHFGGDAREQGSGDGGSFVSTFLQGKLGAHWQAQVEGVEGTWRELYDGRGKYVGGESDYAGLSCEAIFWSPVLVKGVCLVELLPDLRPRINAAHSEPGSLTAVQPSMLSKVLKKQMILRVAQDARFSRWSCFGQAVDCWRMVRPDIISEPCDVGEPSISPCFERDRIGSLHNRKLNFTSSTLLPPKEAESSLTQRFWLK
ncbi:hypothetical protein B0H16DRAFT_1706035 [Mycena metata]|uniref:Uncharacterized protein n=1 Tax=Mycena metata TaxID=1033252 RepID=A0AAD7DSU2_9AGAR|nr:hypothetical protein B0H16DRAFT_1706035 [Mycena metata]